MSEVIPLLCGDMTILIEIDADESMPELGDEPRPGVPPGMRAVGSVERVGRNFNEVKELVVLVANQLSEAISQIPRPTEFSAEFGVKLAGEAGLPVITKASAEGTLKIQVKWEPGKSS